MNYPEMGIKSSGTPGQYAAPLSATHGRGRLQNNFSGVQSAHKEPCKGLLKVNISPYPSPIFTFSFVKYYVVQMQAAVEKQPPHYGLPLFVICIKGILPTKKYKDGTKNLLQNKRLL
ncbi:MAG TPA: hypothetical protein PKC39_11805 [Ferruginibacter sp.]|nr:hypothetical protein [Ferruginibacter sp.]HMP21635.1 hypothetical protein [Ferruginibacter sp.]